MRTLLLLAVTLGCLAAPSALAQSCPTRDSWPTTDWPVRPVDPIAKAAAVKNLEDSLLVWQEPDSAREGLRTEGLVIIKNGAIIYEKYARGFTASTRHISWSVAKSVSSTLVGVAVQQGALTLQDSICKHLAGYAGSGVCGIRVLDTITFGTGLRWQEGYEYEPYQTSSVIAGFLGVGHRDQLRHILTHDTEKVPGTRWMYSTGDAQVAASVARASLLGRFGKDAFWSLFFDKLGATSFVVEEDALGSPLGGSHMWATPRDYARIGYFMLNDGCWAGERLVPAGWVQAATSPSAVFLTGAPGDGADLSATPTGYAWWLNRPVTELKDASGKVVRAAGGKPWPEAPEDAYGANGHWGQFIWVVPSEDLVIVRTGDDRKAGIDQGKVISLAIEVAR